MALFRVVHNAKFTEQDRENSNRISRNLHEVETRACLENIFRCRQAKASAVSY